MSPKHFLLEIKNYTSTGTKNRKGILLVPKAHSESSQVSKMGICMKAANG